MAFDGIPNELLDELEYFVLNDSPTATALIALVAPQTIQTYTDVVPELLVEILGAPAENPHIIMLEVDSSSPTENISDAGDLEETHVQFICRANTPALAAKIRRKIRDGLIGFRGNLTNIRVANVSLATRARYAEPPVDGNGKPIRDSIITFSITHSVPLPS